MGGGLLTNTTKGEVIVNSGIGSHSLHFSLDSTSVSLAGGLQKLKEKLRKSKDDILNTSLSRKLPSNRQFFSIFCWQTQNKFQVLVFELKSGLNEIFEKIDKATPVRVANFRSTVRHTLKGNFHLLIFSGLFSFKRGRK